MAWLGWLTGRQTGMPSSRSRDLGPDVRSSLLDANMLSMSVPPSEASLMSEEQRYIQRRIQGNPMWTLDRGTGFYDQERLSKKKASLLGTGRNAGKSSVQYHGIEWTRILKHVWKRDFFTTAVHARFYYIVLAMVVVFISSFLLWACVYYTIWRVDETCFLGFNSFLSAFLFSIETQNTIGYGSHAIGDCWLPAWLVGIQCISAVLLEAVFLGVVFAKISHPKGRSRTILISECACIARRDGIVKFMFRLADIRRRTAISPKIHAHLYTWGPGHTTAEREYIGVAVQPLPLHYLDSTLLLPVVVEHTIDERSPLYGHTSESLEALGAEIVITFEGHSELGDSFMRRQSYLPSEIHWGCVFVNIIHQAPPGSMQHSIDLSRFHDVEPQEGLALMPPQRLSKAVVLGGARRIPRPLLGENTLLLADELVVTQAADGRWFVAVRVGDAYPSQMCSASVKMFIYRYNSTPSAADYQTATQTYTHQELPLTRHLWSSTAPSHAPSSGQQQHQAPDFVAAASTAAATAAVNHAGGGVNVLLRYPVVVGHEIAPTSPLKDWITPEGMLKDADAEIVVVASAIQYITSHLAMRSKVYSVLGSIRWGFNYAPCVVPPKRSPTGHALVEWSHFHDVIPVHPAARNRGLSRPASQHHLLQQYRPGTQHGAADAYVAQVEDVVEHQTGHQLSQHTTLHSGSQQSTGHSSRSQQRQQQQRATIGALQEQMQQEAAAVAAEAAAAVAAHRKSQQQQQQQQQQPGSLSQAAARDNNLQAVVVQGERGVHFAAPVKLEQQRQQQEQQGGYDFEQYMAHSVGFADLHSAGQMQVNLHAQQQQQQQQQLSRRGSHPLPQVVPSAEAATNMGFVGGSSSRSSSAAVSMHLLDAGATAAAAEAARGGMASTAAAAAPVPAVPQASRAGSGGASSSGMDNRHHSQQQQQQPYYDDDEQHTLTVLPAHKQGSWASKRSLAGLYDMFDSASTDETTAAAAGPVSAAGEIKGSSETKFSETKFAG